MLAVTILGNNSAIPAFNRHPTAQIVHTPEQNFLVDCGEGTQSQLSKYKIKYSKINHIFISHLHGDHYFGLIGLLTSMGLLGRKHELHIYATGALQTIIELQLKVAAAILPYEIHFHALMQEEIILEDKKIEVKCFKVKHRIECWGFLFTEKKHPRKIIIEEVKKYNIPTDFYERLHMGEDYVDENNATIKNELLTSAVSPPKNYAYCADTIYDEDLVEKIKNTDLIYHETTYLQELAHLSTQRGHSTTLQAAAFAKKVNCKKLIVGHYSSRYDNITVFEEECKTIFQNTVAAYDGLKIVLDF